MSRALPWPPRPSAFSFGVCKPGKKDVVCNLVFELVICKQRKKSILSATLSSDWSSANREMANGSKPSQIGLSLNKGKRLLLNYDYFIGDAKLVRVDKNKYLGLPFTSD